MDNKEFAKALEERTLKFAIRIIKLSTELPKSSEAGLKFVKAKPAKHNIGWK